MAIQYTHLGAIFMALLITLPWPGPIPLRDPCSRDRAAVVRKVVLKRWIPILNKMGANLPIECPLHPIRDLFYPQESQKLKEGPQESIEWSCGFCGKSFYKESHLDAHMSKKHGQQINEHEDSICLADFCDIMRCEVLQERLREINDSPDAEEEWSQSAVASRKAVPSDQAIQPALPRSLMRFPHWQKYPQVHIFHAAPPPKTSTIIPIRLNEDMEPGEVKKTEKSCDSEGPCSQKERDEDDKEHSQEIPVFSLPSWKDTCSDEHLAELRAKCQAVIKQCISGLVVNLTIEQVKSIEGALHKTVCWYLTCDRYWESGTFEPPNFPWGIIGALVLLLTFGVSMAYYVVWVFFESIDSKTNTPVSTEDKPFIAVQSKPEVVYRKKTNVPSRTSSLGRPSHSQSTSRARFSATESESECRDSGFNEGGLFPDIIEPHSFDYDSRTRHYSEDSRVSVPQDDRYYAPEERMYNYASTFTPNYEQRRLKRNRYNYLDDFDNYSEFDADDNVDAMSRERSDSFIYVSYPPEIKKKFMENR